VDEVEKERPGPTYTVDTIAELHRRHPGDDFFLLVGSDTLQDVPIWHEPVELLKQAGLVVMARPGHPVPDAPELRGRLGLPEAVPLRLEVVQAPLIDISSRDLRNRAAAGRSLRYFLPRAVECYILEKHLYRTGS
jgi:nicotinate-nucleotide adenylyltransferase